MNLSLLCKHGLLLSLTGAILTLAVSVPASEPDSSALQERLRMIETQLIPRGITDRRVLGAFEKVERHAFVPDRYRAHAYQDHALPIQAGQTISQPYIVALMTQLIDPLTTDTVLEIGTGSGYQAAMLAAMGVEVYTVEIVPELADHARETLDSLGYDKVQVRAGDGWLGWPEAAPFDGIIVTAAAPRIPEPLVEQLKTGGRLVIPVGQPDGVQQLVVYEKDASGELVGRHHLPVRFVPVTGGHGR